MCRVVCCDCCSTLGWKRLTAGALNTNALAVMTPFSISPFDVNQTCNLMLNRLRSCSTAWPLSHKTSASTTVHSTTAKGFASANTSLETATYPYIPKTKILLLCLATNTLANTHNTLLCKNQKQFSEI